MKIYWRCCKSIFCLSPEQDSVANWRLPGPLLVVVLASVYCKYQELQPELDTDK